MQNNPDAVNPAMRLWLTIEDQRRRVADLVPFGRPTSRFMKTLLKLYCWCTLLGDAVLITCSALTGCLGNGYPYARMHVGSFEVSSRMPGGGGFLIAIALWTGILASAVLWLLRGRDSHSAELDASPIGGPAMPFGNPSVPEGPPSVT